jgi:hypothetical protein
MVALAQPRYRFAEQADGEPGVFAGKLGAANVGRSLPRARFAIVTQTAHARPD